MIIKTPHAVFHCSEVAAVTLENVPSNWHSSGVPLGQVVFILKGGNYQFVSGVTAFSDCQKVLDLFAMYKSTTLGPEGISFAYDEGATLVSTKVFP